jgi:dTDP-glucose pyrophosphorylase
MDALEASHPSASGIHSVTKVTSIILDLLAVAGCYMLAAVLRSIGRVPVADYVDAIGLALVAAAVQVAGNVYGRVYEPTWPARPRDLLSLAAPAAFVAGTVIAFNIVNDSHPIPYAAIPTAAVLSVALEIAIHTRSRWRAIQSAVVGRRAAAEVLPAVGQPVLDNLFMSPDAPIRRAIEIIERDVARIALVVDDQRVLLGVTTDGDVRRAILSGIDLDGPVSAAMSLQPIVARSGATEDEVLALMGEHVVRQIPLVNAAMQVVDIKLLDLPSAVAGPMCSVLIMAGGLGARLGELTRNLPKPLVRIGGRPILEMLIRDLAQQGFRRIILAVNYKAELIEQHFSTGQRFGVQIDYVREPMPLGTAGAIRLAEPMLGQEFIVTNADLLTRVNFRELLSFHRREQHRFTVAVIESTLQLRYGLIQTEGSRVVAIKEKPALKHFVNAGIYVLDKGVVDLIPAVGRFDMDEFIEAALARRELVGCFPIHEYWTDIGEPEDFRRATEEFADKTTRAVR